MSGIKILGVTPARGGSKGIPRKNIKEICGKPLLAWTVEAARESKLLDDYVVSTEDDKIAVVASSLEAKVLKRPRELAADDTTTLSVLQHVVSEIPCETVVLLQATSPIRRPGLIDECIYEFKKNGYDSLATGFICKYKEYSKGRNLRRQDIEGFFYDDGNVYVMRADLIKRGDRYGKKIGRKIIGRWENLEIDDEFDFWMAQKALSEKSRIKFTL